MSLHAHEITVRWRDSDALGHVNNAVFLTYFEEGRDGYLQPRLDGDGMYVVVRIELDLLHEIKADERRVMVAVQDVVVGRTSITTVEEIRLDSGVVAARARVVSVRWDAAARTALALTDGERERLARPDA